MNTVLVSACLIGVCSRYDGQHKCNRKVLDYIRDHNLIPVPVCPEQLGGLATPRPKSWFAKGDGDKVLTACGELVNEHGEDVTSHFLRGAEETYKIAQLSNARSAILQQRSPSCGFGFIYLENQLVAGNGVTAALLNQKGLTILSDDKLAG